MQCGIRRQSFEMMHFLTETFIFLIIRKKKNNSYVWANEKIKNENTNGYEFKLCQLSPGISKIYRYFLTEIKNATIIITDSRTFAAATILTVESLALISSLINFEWIEDFSSKFTQLNQQVTIRLTFAQVPDKLIDRHTSSCSNTDDSNDNFGS